MSERGEVNSTALFWRWGSFLLLLLTLTAATLTWGARPAEAAQATLNWSAPTTNTNGSTLTDLAGYKVYLGSASHSYQQKIDVGKVTSYAASNLTAGSTYYFAVTAYDTAGNESSYSNEVTKTVAVSTYTVTATCYAGGTLTAVGNSNVSTATNGTTTITSVTVAAGSSQSFTITPASGYAINGVSVDGNGIGPVTSYTFSSVGANHTIAASFVAASTSTGSSSSSGGVIFAVNSGGASYTNSSGLTYSADTAFSGGTPGGTTATISGTTEGPLYQSERYGTSFSYNIPAANGTYNVTLKFAESYFTASGKRIFSVAVNGTTAVSNLDIYAKVGANAAYDVTVPVSVTNGTINVVLTASVNNAEIRGIKVAAATSTAPASGTVAFATNAGGSSYTSGSTGVTYQADADYSGGTLGATTATISGTSDGALYQSERYGNFSYAIPMANGNYNLTLKFAESYFTASGKRVFNVAVNGTTVISNLDIFAKAGANTAYDVVVPVSVTNGTLNVTFTSVINNAEVRGLLVKTP
ncbi:fibronectin type III domain-containing protein [Geomonas sp. Red32]|uniref:malectin domain-containing carbohydrate-binding protein n=1 Tax=Geomonas sp. Red32 TaxID=2912856 RepID=UPI00202CEABB|nr:malectin domain-containing carbohydrate-binding protein [Geomonas sp. Red32]MCM0082099.1 fibronectin type III domain-containing protein [Geomonas sp. Red32]